MFINQPWRCDEANTISFQLKFALAHGHTIVIYFTYWNEVPGAIVCRGHKQKVRSTPLQPYGLPKEAKPCAVGCISGDHFNGWNFITAAVSSSIPVC
jgi:hypothetical protein